MKKNNKILEVFKENMIAIIVIIVVAAIAITYFAVDYFKEDPLYEPKVLLSEPPVYENIKYEENQYVLKEVSDQDMALRYYRYINYYLVTNPHVIWEKLDKDQRKEYGKESEFNRRLKNMLTVNTLSNTLIKYGVDDTLSTERVFTLVDSEHYSYTVIEKGVWNITVKVNGKVNPDSM